MLCTTGYLCFFELCGMSLERELRRTRAWTRNCALRVGASASGRDRRRAPYALRTQAAARRGFSLLETLDSLDPPLACSRSPTRLLFRTRTLKSYGAPLWHVRMTRGAMAGGRRVEYSFVLRYIGIHPMRSDKQLFLAAPFLSVARVGDSDSAMVLDVSDGRIREP